MWDIWSVLAIVIIVVGVVGGVYFENKKGIMNVMVQRKGRKRIPFLFSYRQPCHKKTRDKQPEIL